MKPGLRIGYGHGARYTTHRPRAIFVEDAYWPEPPVRMEVIIEQDAPVDTGLVDEFGTTIYRVPERRRVGF